MTKNTKKEKDYFPLLSAETTFIKTQQISKPPKYFSVDSI
jgi:hypothetical protein